MSEQNTPTLSDVASLPNRIAFFSENELRDAIKEAASEEYNTAFNDGIDTVQKLLRKCNPISLSPLELANVLELIKLGKKVNTPNQ